ncbi:hypothetical protein PoB_002472800 [Plakobranchus ocellatus]|uniref:CUB domain-containing protein n=1 Tax=Plakobranchus ocellatus TaxID=259542 RepID=A0AAV3ZTN6_9GAST|nr:hypothetical protein PoB_002472800 [Plakobranchus ocellatus]
MRPDWSNGPDGIFLRETSEGVEKIIEISAPRALSRDPVMYVSTSSFSTGYGFRCDQRTVCANGMYWRIAHQQGKDVFIVEINTKLEGRLFPHLSQREDYLEWHVFFLDEKTSACNNKHYYRLIVFPEGMHRGPTYMLPDVSESEREMKYSINVTWTEMLAGYLFIFPSLDDAGIRCEWDKQCDGRFLFRKQKISTGSLFYMHIDKTEDLTNYAVFLMDKSQVDFRIYRFSSHSEYTPDPSAHSTDSIFSKNSAIVLLAVLAGACLLALATLLTARIYRSRKVRSRRETVNQAVSEMSQSSQSDGYEVLPGDRISGDYEHIVEDRRSSDGYESMMNEGVARNVLCNRKVSSSSSHYQRISLENLRTSLQGESALSQKEQSLLKVSKSCGDLASGKADTFEHADDRKIHIEQEPEPFCSTLDRQNIEEEEQPRLQWFMLRDSIDEDGRCAGAFYSIEAEQSTELKDFSTRGRCSADADGEGEYLTALDSSREHEDYLELIAD